MAPSCHQYRLRVGQRTGKPIKPGYHQRVTGSARGEGQPKTGSVAVSEFLTDVKLLRPV
jgi:hypothetical protein